MKKIFRPILVLLLMVSSISIAQSDEKGGWREGEKQIRISNPEFITQLASLKINLDFYPPAYDHITAYVTPNELEEIDALDIPYTVEIEDLNTYYKDYWLLLDAYHSYQQIIELADSLAGAFPSICKKYIVGYSIQNRQCIALKVSDNVTVDEPEPEVMFDGGIHGDEIGGAENLIRFARDLCLNYGVDPSITNLIDTREIWLYVMVNPDGRYNMSRYNANGVDLNRDWGYMWDAWGGSPGAFSQVETRTLRDFMYDNQFVVYTSYHSGTEIISYPWSYRPNACPDQSHINQLAQTYSSLSGYSSLPYGQGYNVMYPINGSTKDGGYGVMGSVSWSIEISNSKQPPTSQIMIYYNNNRPSMLALIEHSGYGLSGTVTDSITGEPVSGIVFVNNYYPCYADPNVGDYHKYVLPGTYSITVKANGYQTKTINNVVVTANNATVTDFQLIPEAGHFVYRFSASQIPDNNYADEGLTSAVIGNPDGINYSLGKSGWCILDMLTPVPDNIGMDFIVYEGDITPEGYTCYVSTSMDGPWISLGMGNGTTQFDISSSGLNSARYIKIVDDGDGVAYQADAGFDLDAIEAFDIVPVELVSFVAENIDDEVILKWTTATETNNQGFEILRSTQNDNELWERIGFVEGKGTTTEITNYVFSDKVNESGTYHYKLKQIDYDGSFYYSEVVEVNIFSPTNFTLFQNYPNPFNPSTKIKYQIPGKDFVTIKIFDVLGNKIASLVNEEKPAGSYEVYFNGTGLPSGLYFYELQTGRFVETRKMILLK